MNPLHTTTLQPEIATWQEIRHVLPPDVNATIERRLASWQRARVDRSAEVAVTPPALLVMRPGTIPRPLDHFFFEIINH